MALLIRTKTPAQCRSHHQKYEAKFRYPHRIIKEEKDQIDPDLYQKMKEKLPDNNFSDEHFEDNSLKS